MRGSGNNNDSAFKHTLRLVSDDSTIALRPGPDGATLL